MARVLRLAAAPFALVALLGLAACDSGPPAAKAEAKKSGPPPTLITTTTVSLRAIEVAEETVGYLENVQDPRVAAEVAGKVVRVLAQQGQTVKQGQLLAEIDSQDWLIQGRTDDAEIARLEALVAQQDRFVERQQRLREQGFISQNAVDDVVSQRAALREQLVAARSKAESGRNSLRKTRVVSPIVGRVQEQIVAEGDFVKVGDALFALVGTQSLIAHLPFPESAASRLKVGLPVRITSPLAPNRVIESRITEIRPVVTTTSRALDVIVKFDTDGTLRGGGTVNAVVITGARPSVVMVPEQSVVLRPAGKVVYVVNEGRVKQSIVETGYKTDGMVEILKGLNGGEQIAVDGAGFLTDNAPVTLPRPAGEKGSGKAAAK